MGRRGKWIWIAVGVALVALVGGRWLAVAAANRLWADALGVGVIHGEIHGIQTMLFATALAAAALWCLGNLYLVYRSIGSVHVPRRLGNIEIIEAVPRQYLLLGAAALGLVLAVALSHRAGGWWYPRALAAVSTRLEINDPLLGRDVAYYLYQLPWQRTLHAFVTLLTGVMLAVTALLYVALGAVRWEAKRLHVADLARMHLGGLLTAFALALLWGYRLEPLEYVAGIHNVPLDTVLTTVRFPVARVLAGLALVTAGASLLWLWSGRLLVVMVAWTVLGVASFVGHYVLPPFAALVRTTAELELRNLDLGRAEFLSLAYGVAPREVLIRPVVTPDASAAVDRSAELATAPVWDSFAVTVLLDRLAASESYARFSEASLTTYPADGGMSLPVYLAARQSDLLAARDAGADLSWELVHGPTYGYQTGVTAVLANRTSRTGLPLFVPDLARPDSTVPDITQLHLEHPEVVFGPTMPDFVVVPPSMERLTGVAAGGLLRRLALAWVLQSPQLVTSSAVADTSLIVWERGVVDRLNRYAPFARFGAAYPVVADRTLYWVSHGYVSAIGFPVASPTTWRGELVHYVRSSLVGVVEASSGRTVVYVARDPDPLTAGWVELAPSLVRPLDELPPSLAPHVRYPADLFQIQLEVVSVGRSADAGRPAADPSPFWWFGTTSVDAVARLRILAALETGDPPVLSGVADGAMHDGRPVLTVLDVEHPFQTPGSAQLAREFAIGRANDPAVQGKLRTVPFDHGVLALQSSYNTPGDLGAPTRLSGVVVAWGPLRGQGATLVEALQNARQSTTILRPTTGVWDEARRWFQLLDSAREIGDWEAFGRAYDELRRLLTGAGGSRP